MPDLETAAFDPDTLAVLQRIFDQAWASLEAENSGALPREALAKRIMTSAIRGERNPGRLLDSALAGLVPPTVRRASAASILAEPEL
jgi:hypothetical protein